MKAYKFTRLENGDILLKKTIIDNSPSKIEKSGYVYNITIT